MKKVVSGGPVYAPQGLRISLGCLGILGKTWFAPVVQSGWLGIGRLLYHGPPGSFDLFRDVHTMTVSSDTTAAPPADNPASILDHFADLPDPRREQGRIHRL